jgi:hypothetical protein
MFTETSALTIINFDAFCFLDRFVLYAESLKSFLEREGAICWGIVPTQDDDALKNADSLLARLGEGISALVKKGIPRELVEERVLLSPSCGLGSLSEAKAESIFRVLAEISAHVAKSL